MEQRREISIAFLKVYRRVFRLNFEDNFLNNIGVTNRIYQYLTKAVPGKFDFVQINDASCAFFLLFDGMSPQQYRDEGTNGKEQL